MTAFGDGYLLLLGKRLVDEGILAGDADAVAGLMVQYGLTTFAIAPGGVGVHFLRIAPGGAGAV